MGRSLQRNDTLSEQSYPGCIAGILKILDYHRWHVKRLRPHKKRGGKKRNRNAKATMERRDLGEGLIDADSEPLPVEHLESDKSARTAKVESNFPSEYGHGSWLLSFPLNSWLQRTNPVQCLESSETCCDDIDTNEKSSVKNDPNKDSQVVEGVDVLEIFKVNKEFFMKILQDPKGRGNQKYLHGLKNSNIKVRLGKSKSFPMAQPPKARPARPTTLEDKQNEVLLFLNKKESHVKDSTKAVSSKGSHGWNQMVVKRFRDIKRKIKRALKESKREESTEKEEEEESSVETTEVFEGLEVTIEDDDVSKPRVHRRVRRTSSLTESLDRYMRLFDDDVSGSKYTKSRSLRLASTSEEEKLLSSRTRKSYRRNLSLPDLDSLSSFLNAPRLSVNMERTQSLANIEECNEIREICSDDEGQEDAARASRAGQEDKACVASYPEDQEPAIEACSSDRLSTLECLKGRAENQDLVFARQILELLTFNGDNEATAFRDEISAESCEVEQHRYGLLFDLVNEAVVEMNERSYGYFPRREREGLMEEIWARISWYMGLRPDLDSSLDDVAARDLATEKGGDWKSSQWEREMVALEIEDLLFDHLLDELLCSLD